MIAGVISTPDCLDRLQMLGHYVLRDRSLEVPYLAPAQQLQQTLKVVDGRFLNAQGQPMTTPHAHLMVVNLNGDMIAMSRPASTIFHHSSLSAGQDVSMAGYVELNEGKLKKVTNTSGHYQPPLPSFEKLLRHWMDQRVDLGGAMVGFQVSITSSKSETFYYELKAEDFLKLMSRGLKDPAELLRAILSSDMSSGYRANAVAHLLLLNQEVTANDVQLLRDEVAAENSFVVDELESLTSSLDFKTVLERLEKISNPSVQRLEEKFAEEMLEPYGSD